MKAVFGDHLNYRLIGKVTVLCGFLLGAFVTPARAQTTIISVTSSGVARGSLGIFPTQSVAFSFTVGQSYSDVTISAHLIGSFSGTAFLMESIGPGTTAANEIASGAFVSAVPPGVWSQFQPVLQNVSLPASGTYIIVLSSTEVSPPQGIVTTNHPMITGDLGASNGPFFITIRGTTDVPYPPAASFYQPTTGFIGEFQVIGIPNLVSVNIDVKPGSFPNSVNLGATGVIPVGILSTSTFNAPAEVDLSTLTLAGASVSVAGRSSKWQCSAEDLNEDGLEDLICHFSKDLTVEPGDPILVLEGRTYGGIAIRGQDSIRVVPR